MFANTTPVSCFLVSEYEVEPETRVLVNVGSVGQPRDLNPQACYVLYDDEAETVAMRRVDYDVLAAADLIKEAGLPPTNAARLSMGR
jgi:diadenosine tetraphosphatase ApaH/serine/threonine PP2A family protein phosphatase